ncbi:hypothetical protein Tco_1309703 [Tanacetum coccineum]
MISSAVDFLSTIPTYTLIRVPLRRLCHRLIAFSIAGRGQTTEKVTTTDLFYLRSMDKGRRLRICDMLGDVVTWVAMGLKRQHAGAAAGATHVDPEVA